MTDTQFRPQNNHAPGKRNASHPKRKARNLEAARDRQRHTDFHAGLIPRENVNQTIQAWIGQSMQGDTWRIREQIFDAFPFLAGDHKPK